MDLLGKLLQDQRGKRARTSKERRSRDTTLQYEEVSKNGGQETFILFSV